MERTRQAHFGGTPDGWNRVAPWPTPPVSPRTGGVGEWSRVLPYPRLVSGVVPGEHSSTRHGQPATHEQVHHRTALGFVAHRRLASNIPVVVLNQIVPWLIDWTPMTLHSFKS